MSSLRDNRFGAHGDVLSASPEDDQSKVKLVDELKSRGR